MFLPGSPWLQDVNNLKELFIFIHFSGASIFLLLNTRDISSQIFHLVCRKLKAGLFFCSFWHTVEYASFFYSLLCHIFISQEILCQFECQEWQVSECDVFSYYNPFLIKKKVLKCKMLYFCSKIDTFKIFE